LSAFNVPQQAAIENSRKGILHFQRLSLHRRDFALLIEDFAMNEYQQNIPGGLGNAGAYSQLFSPQALFGGLAGNRGIGAFGNPGTQFGQTGGIGATGMPYNIDPYAQQQFQQLQQQPLQQLQQQQYFQHQQQQQLQQQLQQQQQFQHQQQQQLQQLQQLLLQQLQQTQSPWQSGQQFGGIYGQFGRSSPFSFDPNTVGQPQQQALQQLQQQLQNIQQLQASLQGWLGNSAGQTGQPFVPAFAQQQAQAVLQAQQQLLQANQALQAVQQCLHQVQQIQQAQLQQTQVSQYGWNTAGQQGQQIGSQFGRGSPFNIDPAVAYSQQAGGYQGYPTGQPVGSFGGGQQTVH
jgi:hypothetical protein